MSPVRAHMGAAAELERVDVARRAEARAGRGAHGDHAHLLAVFLAEEGAGAEALGGVGRHDPGLDGGVLADVGVHLGLDAASSSRVIAFWWAKSKRRRSGATRLPRWATWSPRARRSASCRRCVAEWCARIAGAPGVVDHELAAAPGRSVPLSTVPRWTKRPAFGGRRDARPRVGRDERAGVADLAAGLGVERGLVEHDLHRLAGGRLATGRRRAPRRGPGLGGLGVVAEELGGAEGLGEVEPDAPPRRPRPSPPRRRGRAFFCSAIAASKPDVDGAPCSRRASWVRSSGKP
jgi:hypothetical protein